MNTIYLDRYEYIYLTADSEYEIDCDYQWVNMLTKMKEKNPRRFYEFYDDNTIYYYMDILQHRHLTND